MTYAAKGAKIFESRSQKYQDCTPPLIRRSDHRLKRFESIFDERAWHICEHVRYRHLLELMSGSQTCLQDIYSGEQGDGSDFRKRGEPGTSSEDEESRALRDKARMLLENKVGELTDELNKSRELLREAMRKLQNIDEIVTENKKLQCKLRVSEERVKFLEERKKRLECELADLRTKSQIQIDLEKAQEMLSKVTKQGEDVQGVSEAGMRRLTAERDQLQEKVKQLEKELEASRKAEAEIEVLRSQSQSNSLDREEITRENECYRKKLLSMKCLEKQVQELKKQGRALADKYKRESQKAAEQMEKMCQATKELQALQEERDSLRKRVDDLASYECEYKKLQQKLLKVNCVIQENENLNSKLQALQKLEKENEFLRCKLESMQEMEINAADDKEKIIQLRCAVADQEEEMKELLCQIEKLTSGKHEEELERLKCELYEKNSKLKLCEEQLAEIPMLEAEIDELRMKLQCCCREFSEKKRGHSNVQKVEIRFPCSSKGIQADYKTQRSKCEEISQSVTAEVSKIYSQPSDQKDVMSCEEVQNLLQSSKGIISCVLEDMIEHQKEMEELEICNKVMKEEIEMLKAKVGISDKDCWFKEIKALKKTLCEKEAEIRKMREAGDIETLKQLNKQMKEELQAACEGLKQVAELEKILEKERKARCEAERKLGKAKFNQEDLGSDCCQILQKEVENLKLQVNALNTLTDELKRENELLRELQQPCPDFSKELEEKCALENLLSLLQAELDAFKGQKLSDECEALRNELKRVMEQNCQLKTLVNCYRQRLDAEKRASTLREIQLEERSEKELREAKEKVPSEEEGEEGEKAEEIEGKEEEKEKHKVKKKPSKEEREEEKKDSVIIKTKEEKESSLKEERLATEVLHVPKEESVKEEPPSKKEEVKPKEEQPMKEEAPKKEEVKPKEEQPVKEEPPKKEEVKSKEEPVKEEPPKKEEVKPKEEPSAKKEEVKPKEELVKEEPPPKKEEVKPKEEPPAKKEEMKPKEEPPAKKEEPVKEEPPPKKEEPAAKKEEPAPKIEEPASKKEEPVPKKDEPVPKKEEPVPKKEEPVPKKEEPAPKKEEPASKIEEPPPKKEEPAAKKEEPVPKKEEPAPKKEEPVPKKEEPAPKKEEPAPKKEEPAPKKEEPAPKKEEPAPKKEEPAPKKEEPAPKKEPAKEEPLPRKEEVKPKEPQVDSAALTECLNRINQLETENAEKLKKLMDQHAKELAEQEKKYNENLNAMKAGYETDIKKLTERHKMSMMKLQGLHEDEVQEMNTTYETQLETMHTQSQAAINEVAQTSAAKLQKLNERHSKEIQEVENKFNKELGGLQDALSKSKQELETLKRKIQKVSSKEDYDKMMAQHARELQKAKKSSKQKVDTMKELLAETKRQSEAEIESLKQELKDQGRGDYEDKKKPKKPRDPKSPLDFNEILEKILEEGMDSLTFNEIALVHRKTCCTLEKVVMRSKSLPGHMLEMEPPVRSTCSHTSLLDADKQQLLSKIFALEEEIVQKQKETQKHILTMEVAIKKERCRLQELKSTLQCEQQRNVELKLLLTSQTKLHANLKKERDQLGNQASMHQSLCEEKSRQLLEERKSRECLEAEIEKLKGTVRDLYKAIDEERGHFICNQKEQLELMRQKLEQAVHQERKLALQLERENRCRQEVQCQLQTLRQSLKHMVSLPSVENFDRFCQSPFEAKSVKEKQNLDQINEKKSKVKTKVVKRHKK